MASLPEHQIYVFATSLMAAFFVAAIIRLWLLRRVEEQLLKNKDALEKQIVIQQKDLMTVRQDANAWRTEMQRQFDLFRHMASDQLGVEEKRFNELLSKSQRREYELLTQLDVTKQMCAELPDAKARILHLEGLLEKALSAPAPAPAPAPAAPAPAPVPETGPSSSSDEDEDGGLPVPEPVSPMPDLGGPSGFMISPPPAPPVEEPEPPAPAPAPAPAPLPVPSPFFPPKFAVPPPPPPSPLASILPIKPSSLPVTEAAPQDEDKLAELEQKLAAAEKKNISLQLVLTKTRLRSRSKIKPSPRTRLVKRGLVLQA